MQKPELIFRADGNATIGLGHIHRTLAFADHLKDHFAMTFYSYQADVLVKDLVTKRGYKLQSLSSPDFERPSVFTEKLPEKSVVVLDGYSFRTDYQKALKENGNKVVVIDDLNQWENVADAVINHGYSGTEYNISPSSKLYAGLSYAIIKPEILNAERTPSKTSNNRILVCIGGTDPDGYSEKIVSSLLKETDKLISLLTYPLNPAFKELERLASENNTRLKLFHSLDTNALIQLIRENDMAVLQPSNIALEAMAIGIHISLIQTAENQKYILETLIENRSASIIDLKSIAQKANAVSAEEINSQLMQQAKLLDRRSPARLLDIINSLILEFRKVEARDVKLIYDWNNDPVTRANSHNTAAIEFADHEKWFSKRITDENLDFLIFSYNSTPCGSVRIERKETENVIGIAIAPEFRGKKLAHLILTKAADYFYRNHGKKDITAYIKKQNLPSIKSFEKVGYRIMNEGEYCGDEGYRLIKS